MKRIFELKTGEIENLNKNELKDIIKYSEGRTVMAETIVSYTPYIKDISNLELAASFGADMITLNTFNFDKPYIFVFGNANLSNGIEDTFKTISEEIKNNIEDKDYIRNIRSLVGRVIGVNLEPVPEGSTYEKGYTLTRENLEKVKEYGFNYIVITGNPSTGITEETICYGIKLAKEILGDSTLIIAGKMHGAGSGNIYDESVVQSFVECGADVVLIPAPGTVPGITEDLAKNMIDSIHEAGGIAMSTIGTSQEGASESTIEKIALMSKMAGADIQHIGDCGTFGMALPENIMKLSVTIRGIRHTYRRMAQSIKR